MQPTLCDVRADDREQTSPPATRAHRDADDAHACVACRAHEAGDRHYAAHAFGAPQRLPQAVEAIADAIGYCAGHARQLAAQKEFLAPLRAALDGALQRWHTWLRNEPVFGERVRELFFHVDRDCPACRFAERHAARAAGALARGLAAPDAAAHARLAQLCFPHFKLLYVDANAAVREALLPQYRSALTGAIARHLTAGASADDDLARWVAGGVHQPDERESGVPAARSAQRIDLPPLLAERSGCPVCRLAAAARERWIESMRLTLRTGQPAWLAFPSCAEHARAAVALGDVAIARAAALHAAEVALSALERRVPPFTPPLDGGFDAAEVRRLRQRRVRRGVVKPEPRPRMSACHACERIGIARDAAISELLDLLRAHSHRAHYARGDGLCLRHFARAYLFAERQTVRPFLVQTQCEWLAQARQELCAPATSARTAVAGALARFNDTGGVR
jgi:ssDNA-binding Zn-finger/Zn-ribbon topoisomerase 1